mmetsp:Transcript_9183/g.20455  ORF Transcript_9183/g.20455 Transcript_9183/m.20455 type:complete len:116 (-) Transcript_9183:68-415(-)
MLLPEDNMEHQKRTPPQQYSTDWYGSHLTMFTGVWAVMGVECSPSSELPGVMRSALRRWAFISATLAMKSVTASAHWQVALIKRTYRRQNLSRCQSFNPSERLFKASVAEQQCWW